MELDFTHVISCELVESAASDLGVVNAARISFDTEHPVLEYADEKLIGYLMRNRHGTPFEHAWFKFKVEAPIFAFREHHRHRAGHSYNEMSGRYTKLEPKFYVPLGARVQEGKPGHYVYVDKMPNDPMTEYLHGRLHYAYSAAWSTYENLLAEGIAKEQARMVLPVGIYSKMIWSCNARSLMHFLGLRLDKTAQKEIRMVAEGAAVALWKAMPVTYREFIKNDMVAP